MRRDDPLPLTSLIVSAAIFIVCLMIYGDPIIYQLTHNPKTECREQIEWLLLQVESTNWQDRYWIDELETEIKICTGLEWNKKDYSPLLKRIETVKKELDKEEKNKTKTKPTPSGS